MIHCTRSVYIFGDALVHVHVRNSSSEATTTVTVHPNITSGLEALKVRVCADPDSERHLPLMAVSLTLAGVFSV